MSEVTYECTKEITVYDPKIKDPVDVVKGTRWELTMICSVDSFQELSCNGVIIALPDELIERHFKKIK